MVKAIESGLAMGNALLLFVSLLDETPGQYPASKISLVDQLLKHHLIRTLHVG